MIKSYISNRTGLEVRLSRCKMSRATENQPEMTVTLTARAVAERDSSEGSAEPRTRWSHVDLVADCAGLRPPRNWMYLSQKIDHL